MGSLIERQITHFDVDVTEANQLSFESLIYFVFHLIFYQPLSPIDNLAANLILWKLP